MIKFIKPQAQFLEIFLIVTPAGVVGILQGDITSWWADGMNSKMVFIVSNLFIVVGILSLFMFIRWLFLIKFDSLVLKGLLKIFIFFLGIIFLGILGVWRKLPYVIVVIVFSWLYVHTNNKLKAMDKMFEEKKDEG